MRRGRATRAVDRVSLTIEPGSMVAAARKLRKLSKGSYVTVNGRLELNRWDAEDGETRLAPGCRVEHDEVAEGGLEDDGARVGRHDDARRRHRSLAAIERAEALNTRLLID